MDQSDIREMKRSAVKYGDLIGIAAVAIVLVVVMQKAGVKDLDPEDFATVNKVSIPDHTADQDPYIIYDRDTWQHHDAGYHVEVVIAGTDKVVCENRGHGFYRKGEKIVNKTLSWYIGKRCNLPSGRYLLKTHWNLRNGVYIHNTSNVYRVLTTRSDFGSKQ